MLYLKVEMGVLPVRGSDFHNLLDGSDTLSLSFYSAMAEIRLSHRGSLAASRASHSVSIAKALSKLRGTLAPLAGLAAFHP
jgi:hypothetical protein